MEIKRLREEHPNIGKEKIYPLLVKFCNENNVNCAYPKPAIIGNLIKDMGGLRTFPQKVRHNGHAVPKKRSKRARKPKQFNKIKIARGITHWL